MTKRVRFGFLGAAVCAASIGGVLYVSAQTAAPTVRLAAAATPTATPSPTATPAPISTDPQSTTATFGDWVLRCERGAVNGQPQRVCEVAQTLEAKGQGVVAQMAFARLSGKEPMHMTIVLPPNVSLTTGVRLSIDDKDENPVDFFWKRCLQGGCVAEGDFKEDALRAWRAQSGAGQIRYAVASGQLVTLSFSFRGLGVALENLSRASAAQ